MTRRTTRPWKRRRNGRRPILDKFKKRTKKARDECVDCAGPDCFDCDGCDCDPGCTLMMVTLITAMLHYFSTAPVHEGRHGARPVLRLIRSYQQNVSAHRPAVCNLSPTCSRYGYETLRDQGLGGVLAVRRRLRLCRETGRSRRSDEHVCSQHAGAVAS